METLTLEFKNAPGSFRDSIRAYREYKREWRARMEIRLAEMEAEILQAKSDPLYCFETT